MPIEKGDIGKMEEFAVEIAKCHNRYLNMMIEIGSVDENDSAQRLAAMRVALIETVGLVKEMKK